MTVHRLPAFPGLVSRESADALTASAKPRCVIDRGTDRELYLVECYLYDSSRQKTHFYQTTPAEMSLAAVIDDICSGQYEDVARVFYFNPVEGVCRDVSEDVARAVADKARAEYRPLTRKVRDFVEQHVSMSYCRGLEMTDGEIV